MKTRRVRVVVLAGLTLAVGACGWYGTPAPAPAPVPAPVARVEAGEPDGPPFFHDITAGSGVDATYTNGEEAGHLAILESLGGGAGLLDFDGDGRLDLVVACGGGYRDKEIVGRPCNLYRNLGGGKFTDVSGLLQLDGPWFYTHACAVADYDRDGWPDLLLTGWGRVALFHNEPIDPTAPGKGRRLVDVTRRAGMNLPSWSASAAWGDLDGDGYPDLYVCCYTDWSFANNPSCSYDGKTSDVCPPKQLAGLPHHVFRNNGNGTFTDVSTEAGLRPGAKDASKGLGVLLIDVDGDGRPEVYVCNDTVDNFLYRNHSTKGKIRLEEVGLYSGVARDDRGAPNGSMGVDAGDYDGSGRPSLWVTNYENELHALYRNVCRPGHVFFTCQTASAGIAAIGQKYVGWGTGFVDLDHHGWPDLVIVNGHAIRYPTGQGSSRRQRPVLLRNHAGRFTDASRRGGDYFGKEHLARGLALGDLDDDGRVDAVVSHLNEPVAVLRNVADTGRNHWLGVELVGKGHADVVGARVVLEVAGRQQTRFARGGGSYASSADRRHVFGLGEAERVGRLTVFWPDGTAQHWDGLAVDRYHRLVQGQAAAAMPPGAKK